MSLWVPPKVSRELREETRRRESATWAQLPDLDVEWVREFDAQLDRIVPGMQLVPCPDPAPIDAVAAGMQPGYWHVVWPGYHGGPMCVLPLEGPDGGRREPGSWVFDMLRDADLWDDRVQRDRRRIQDEIAEARARRLERERAERDQDVLERYVAGTRTQVSMNRGSAWSQNAAGARAAKANRRRVGGYTSVSAEGGRLNPTVEGE